MDRNAYPEPRTEIEEERLSPAFLARLNEAYRTGEVDGKRPPEEVLRSLCSDCNEYGLVASGYHAAPCPHRIGWMALMAVVERHPVFVRKAVA